MVYFSETKQAFYLEHNDSIENMIEIDDDQHFLLLELINSGCHVFSDLTASEPKPSQFHIWKNDGWIDERPQEEIEAYNRSLLPKISKRKFALYLFDHNMYDQVMQAIEANPRFKIEYDTVSDIERLSPTVSEMTALLGWTEEQVDQMWEQALTL